MKKLFLLLLMLPMGLIAQEVKIADNDTTVMTVVEEQPEYPGGPQAMYAEMAKDLKYPEKARGEGRQGRVIVEFIVEKDGTITHVKVIKDEVGCGAGEEVVRVVKNMPPFIPGKAGGKAVRAKYSLPVLFQLNDDPPAEKDKKNKSKRNR